MNEVSSYSLVSYVKNETKCPMLSLRYRLFLVNKRSWKVTFWAGTVLRRNCFSVDTVYQFHLYGNYYNFVALSQLTHKPIQMFQNSKVCGYDICVCHPGQFE